VILGSAQVWARSFKWRQEPSATLPSFVTSAWTGDERSPLFGAGNTGVIARGGRLFRRDDESRNESYENILARAGLSQIEGHGKGAMDQAAQAEYAMHSHGAVFAEVKVDPGLGQIRVTRLVGAFAAGRIINPHLARSQYLGGMIWGLSFALQEEAIVRRQHH